MVTLRHQIGQMLIMGFSGTVIDDLSPVKEWLSTDGLGGVLLFDFDLTKQQPGKNLLDIAQIKRLTQQLTHYANKSAGKEGLPLFIALDYEGGAVDRLRHIKDCMATMSSHEMAQLSDDLLQIEARKMAETLKNLGFNLNFAPVVDLNLNENQGIIGKLGRSFSVDPKRVAHIARQFVDVFSKQGISCCYKHFPGHGSAVGDTHHGFVDVTATFQKSELEPYRLLLRENTSLPIMVMTAHVINRQLDASGLPATLSQAILTGLLRQELGFDGVIISDDLQMHAISKHYSVDDALRLTINAGADMIIFANQLGEITATEVIDRIEQLVLLNAIERDRIDQAYQRISRLKRLQLALEKTSAVQCA
ncbi:glycoside hydrolase family 3 protein [Legionella tunisiensis]|uniref:glycoside hydrolase family 3 protein n=1 Tax=Legionella tunisiensis TaxID=1034944 RepID=UPI0002E6A321|nr:glycoside hydrolase family 3 N-terminal domain-containing protein [Legionella tunisiensis]